ncbi:MAG: hypothetical protein HKN47_18205 [Pirellulaceae bacterium]|nr:hypothetical protein [Pirellulaceae bacterium]
MSIQKDKNGFFVWGDYQQGSPGLGVQSDRIDECIDYYHANGFNGLFGSASFGFDQDNLDFLVQAPAVQWLWFWDINLKNIDPLYGLNQLNHFGIHPKRPGIDFSRLPSLRTAVNFWIKSDTGITKSKITEYYHWHYKPRDKSYEGLEMPKNVKKLEMNWANPASLEGLPVMKKLKSLQFHRCRNLNDLSALPRVAPNLENLLITTSSKVDPTDGILDHPTLKSAWIDGNEYARQDPAE